MTGLIERTFSQISQCVVSMVLCFLFLGLTACVNDDVSDLMKFVEKEKAKPKGAIPPLSERNIVESFHFKPNPKEGFRDPFTAFEGRNNNNEPGDTCASASRIQPDPDRRKEELEEYSLDTLLMVGTLTMNKGLWALIKASDNTIHRVKKGNYMGRNHGAIIRILNDKIELREIIPDKPCAWRERPASLALSE